VLAPGATIGILGGGQLGRMLALAAAPLGLRAHVFAPEADSPAFHVAAARTVARYDDEEALAAFAAAVDVVTTEFENVPARTAEALAARVPVRPSARALAIVQDRLPEKEFVRGLGIAVAPFAGVDTAQALAAAGSAIGFPQIVKTRRLGYDGKGQIRIARAEDAPAAWEALGGAPCVVEAVVAFAREVSVVAARGADGAFAAYEPTENVHEGGVLRRSSVPATIDDALAACLVADARRIGDALDHVGAFAVEFFVTAQGAHLVNEIAPRVHNSGHWTIEGAATSQFEQHVRAVAGWPLGATARRAKRVEMANLIGEEAAGWAALAAEPGAHLHLYGKGAARPGRKMGHVTRLV
jgi:5-(carboxyamino)imidazole ribonucleotide synthase